MSVIDTPGSLLTRLSSNAQSLVIAAPYIKVNALSTVLANVNPEASLTCVTRWNLQDIGLGASDIECRTMITERGGSFMLHPSLHAKYYRVDDIVLLGSANLTPSAMGWSSQPNLEILCRAGDDFDALAFQQSLLEGARELTDAEFRSWVTLTAITAESNSMLAVSQPQLDTWRPATRDPRHLELSYQGREEEIASVDEQQAAWRDIQALSIPQGLTDEQVRAWVSACLLATPFANTVIQLRSSEDAPSAIALLAATYGLSATAARRGMETAESWLAFLAPETLHKA